jgi:hypothetical protein
MVYRGKRVKITRKNADIVKSDIGKQNGDILVPVNRGILTMISF